MAYITIRMKNEDGHTQEDLNGDRIVVGRTDECGITIKHESISRNHCAFVKNGEHWQVEDLGSSNGTRVNAHKITDCQTLEERDIVKIGKARLTFHVGERKKKRSKRSTEDGIALEADALKAGANAEAKQVGLDDPAEATTCSHCGAWFSIAHRLAGDTMNCPACGKPQRVPQLIS